MKTNEDAAKRFKELPHTARTMHEILLLRNHILKAYRDLKNGKKLKGYTTGGNDNILISPRANASKKTFVLQGFSSLATEDMKVVWENAPKFPYRNWTNLHVSLNEKSKFQSMGYSESDKEVPFSSDESLLLL